ncbi:translocated intimin receptor Tir [Granulicella sp. 5B5]|nr:translocated intimin receptor Tir [Granulicella sp. 5B5]
MAQQNRPQTIKAILTDIQFWVPALVLIAGIVLLILLH